MSKAQARIPSSYVERSKQKVQSKLKKQNERSNQIQKQHAHDIDAKAERIKASSSKANSSNAWAESSKAKSSKAKGSKA